MSASGCQRRAQLVEQRALPRRRAARAAPAARPACRAGPQLARAHLAQRDARGDALDVADAAQRVAQRLEAVRDAARRWRRGAALATRAVAQRVRQPVAQRAAAHAGAAGVEQRQQRRRCPRRAASASARGCGAWPAAGRAGRWRARTVQRAHVRQRLALRVLGIAQQRGGGGMRGAAGPAALKPARLATCSCSHSLRWPSAASNCQAGRCGAARRAPAPRAAGSALAVDAAPRPASSRASQPASSRSPHSVRPSCAAGQAQPGQARSAAPRVRVRRASSSASARVGQQFAVGHGAGRDHAHHLALDRALGGGHVADLLGDRHRLAQLDQLAPGSPRPHAPARRPSPPARRRSGRAWSA